MAVVWIPSLLRDLTQGQARVEARGETVGQLVEDLDKHYPGIAARLCPEGKLRPGLSVGVDGAVSRRQLRQRVSPASEVMFLPAISGG